MPRAHDPGRASAVVRELAKRHGLRIDAQAEAFVAAATAGDLYRADAELEKIDLWLGGQRGGKVTLDVAREVVVGDARLSVWEVADAILARDRSAAMAAVAHLVEAGDEPIRIVGGLAYRVRNRLQPKPMLAGAAPLHPPRSSHRAPRTPRRGRAGRT